MDRSKVLLWDVLHAIAEIDEFLSGMDEDRYLGNRLVRAAIERKMQIIGEALAKLSKVEPKIAGKIPGVSQIIGFRNVLVHGYAVVESSTVYEIAVQRLPELEVVVRRLLAE